MFRSKPFFPANASIAMRSALMPALYTALPPIVVPSVMRMQNLINTPGRLVYMTRNSRKPKTKSLGIPLKQILPRKTKNSSFLLSDLSARKLLKHEKTFGCPSRNSNFTHIIWCLSHRTLNLSLGNRGQTFATLSRSLVTLSMVMRRFVGHYLLAPKPCWASWRSQLFQRYVEI